MQALHEPDRPRRPLTAQASEVAGRGGDVRARTAGTVASAAGVGAQHGPVRDVGHVAMLVVLRRLAMSALLTALGRLGLLTGLVMLTTLAVLAFLAAAVLVVLAM